MGGESAFAFVNSQYIITAEVASEHTFVVNFINLSDYVIVVQPNEFIYRGASGLRYIGQVFEWEHQDSRGEAMRYSASILIKGHSFTGMTIVGAFHEQDQIDELSVRIGSRRYYLQSVGKVVFEQLAAKVSQLDLENPDGAAALLQANIDRMGTVRSTDGTSEWDRDWQGLISQDGINPPKIIERPEISPTSEARRRRTYGKVRLSAIINRNGGIQDLSVVKGLGRGLDERALEGVKNSWVFLPATKNGEVINTAIAIDVEFPPPSEQE
jgi:TonB family protein